MRDFLYCLIFPHPSNNHRAGILHHRFIILTISFFVLSSLFFSSSISPLPGRAKAFAEVSITELLNLTNQQRQENGLAKLSSNSELTQAASKKADDMFAKNYWAHNSPSGTTPWVFIRNSGYDYVYAGENLARGFNDSRDVVNAWMASPDHRANILSPNFKDVGFSVKEGKLDGEDTFLVVEEFGSKNVLPIANSSSQPNDVLGAKKFLGLSMPNYLINRPTLSLSSEIAMVIIFLFIVVLLVDMFVVRRKKIVRFVGHNTDHAIFLLIILFVIAVFNIGGIL